MEKYGTIPPKFTKEWWEYFWDYYKVHTICTVAAIVIIVSSVVQCANAPEYDLELIYVKSDMMEINEVCDNLSKTVGKAIDDITGDGEKLFNLVEIPIVPTNPEGYTDSDSYNIQLVTKFDIELTFGEKTLMLVNDGVAHMMKEELSYYGYLEDLSKYGEFGDKALYSADGKVIGVDVSDNTVLRDAGIETDGLYLMARGQLAGEENDEKLSNIHSNTLKAVEYILK